MHVHCESCNAMVRADDMNLATGLAKCRFCHAVFPLPGELLGPARPAVPPPLAAPDLSPAALSASRAAPPPSSSTEPAEGETVEVWEDEERVEVWEDLPGVRPIVVRPEGLGVIDQGGSRMIVRRWRSLKYWFFAVFSVFWMGFLVMWYGMALLSGAPLVFLLFPLIHLAVGVGLVYVTAAGFLNRTHLRVADGVLTVTHGPVPWPGNRSIPLAELEQLYTEEKVARGKNGVTVTYDLKGVLRNGRRVSIFSGADDRDVALYAERQLETWLGIQDRPVRGEVRR